MHLDAQRVTVKQVIFFESYEEIARTAVHCPDELSSPLYGGAATIYFSGRDKSRSSLLEGHTGPTLQYYANGMTIKKFDGNRIVCLARSPEFLKMGKNFVFFFVSEVSSAAERSEDDFAEQR